jgi:uncharacterized protein (DUF305 family)
MPQVCGFARTVRPGLGPAPAAVPVRPVPVVMTLLVAVLFGVSGCTDSSPTPAASSYTAPVPVVQPGRPGEPATTVAPGQTAARPPEATWNGADLYFVSMMVVHHTQALRMARLADSHSSSPQVKAVAERISAAQAPEVQTLRAWLTARDQKVPNSLTGADHGHAEMPGAVTPARLEALARAKGTAFDRLFLDLMVAHHAGAVQMADTVTTAGTDQAVQEIAAETAVGQSAEIRRMKEIRAGL